ncbi:MAG: hypothetical protein Q8O51_00915 [bacterium]|nr:hypothetical protein [bacterium]
MIIELQKFGTTLISRQAGREAFSAFSATLQGVPPTEILMADFQGVLTFSPSWGDEFLTPLQAQLGNRFVLHAIENPSVKATVEILEKTNGKKFIVQ